MKKFGKGISSCTTYVCGKERFNYVLYTLTHKISKNGICIRKITLKVCLEKLGMTKAGEFLNTIFFYICVMGRVYK